MEGLPLAPAKPGADPIGSRFTFGRLGADHTLKWVTIVGVVTDTKMYGLANPARLEVYVRSAK